jgi:hypothetical protein
MHYHPMFGSIPVQVDDPCIPSRQASSDQITKFARDFDANKNISVTVDYLAALPGWMV